MESYEERIVLKRIDNFVSGQMEFSVLTEEEASKLDLTGFEDLSDNLMNAVKGSFSAIPGTKVVNGVKKGGLSETISYVGIIIDTRKTSREAIQKSFDAAATFSTKFKKNLTDHLIKRLKSKESITDTESSHDFINVFKDTLVDIFGAKKGG